MNPESRRNLWLELTPRRVLLMVVVLALSIGSRLLAAWLRKERR